jgi:excinuclease ABC subunit C
MVMFDIAAFLKSLTQAPGVYRMLNEAGQVIYVGKARNLKRRVSSYFQKTSDNPRTRLMVAQIRSIEVTLTSSEGEALLLESNLIKSLKPRYNVLFKDDKSYPYILVTEQEYPQIRFFRGHLQAGGNRYFGPYPNAAIAHEVVGHLQRLFRLRTCEDSVFRNRSRPCLMFQIGRCSAPCTEEISPAHYQRDIAHALQFLQGQDAELIDELRREMAQFSAAQEFEQAALLRDRILLMQQVLAHQAVASTQARDADVVAVVNSADGVAVNWVMIRQGRHLGDRTFFPQNAAEESPTVVAESFLAQHYSVAPVPAVVVVNCPELDPELENWLSLRAGRKVHLVTRPQSERRAWVKAAEKNALFALEQHHALSATETARLAALQQALDLDLAPARIECFDISHTQGELPVGSCVVFENGKPCKTDYRRYNITGITPGDDYAAQRQVLERRYRRLVETEGKLPDLVLMDGGLGQTRVALDVLQEMGLPNLCVVGVAKGEGRKAGLETLIVSQGNHTLKLSPDHPGFHLIQAIRDEAHRFAITGHRARRAKVRTRSVLEDLPGVGPGRRQKLLTHFGGIKGVEAASLEDIARVEGIGPALAQKIWDFLH